MEASRSPYTPGAGTKPPTLAGRDALMETAKLALERIAHGRHAKSFIAVGLRGVGKTVVLNEVAELADGERFQHVYIEAFDEIRFADALTKALRPVLMRLSRREAIKALASRAVGALRNFAAAFKVSFDGFEFGVEGEPGVADTGDITADLPDLLVLIGQAAKAHGTALAIIVDEIQYLSEQDLSAIIMAVHRCNQKALPVVLFGAGLPQVRGKMGNAKSYVERLFDFPMVDALTAVDATLALEQPARAEGVEYTRAAIAEIIRVTCCYPYFLQEWGHFAWLAARASPITKEDVIRAHTNAIAKLDESFFRVRLERTTPGEKKYMRALAELGPGSHRSGDIAKIYQAKVTSVAPLRSGLIAKGMIYSPAHGDTAFTVPLFDEFMRREVPNFGELAV